MVEKCKCCGKMKELTTPTKLQHGIYSICPTCKEELKWTTTVLRIGARNAVANGTHYRISDLVVAEI